MVSFQLILHEVYKKIGSLIKGALCKPTVHAQVVWQDGGSHVRGGLQDGGLLVSGTASWWLTDMERGLTSWRLTRMAPRTLVVHL